MSCALNVSVPAEKNLLPPMRTIIGVFIFHFCANLFSSSFVSSFWTTCSQFLKILSCLREEACVTRVTFSIPARSSGLNHDVPCCIEPELRSTCILFNVNLCCFELFTSGSMTARNILTWLWLIFEDNFVLSGHWILVAVHSWNRSTYLKETIFSAVYKSQNP